MSEEFRSLLVIATITAFVPLIVGLFRIRVAEVVLLLGASLLPLRIRSVPRTPPEARCRQRPKHSTTPRRAPSEC